MEQLRRAVDAVARTFDGRGSTIKERELELALEAALRSIEVEPVRQARVELGERWSGRVGGVDLALDDADGSRHLIELKWDRSTLAACAWDSVKLACALQAGVASRAFLVAGSRKGVSVVRGDGLLEDCELQPRDLRGEYAAEFDYWRKDVENHPVRVPAQWTVHKRHAATLSWKGEPWQIRLAEVELGDDRLLDFE